MSRRPVPVLAASALAAVLLASPALAAGTAPAILPPPAPGMDQSAQDQPAQPFTIAAVTSGQRAELGRLNAYFNSIRYFSGNFRQISPDGTTSQGSFWISKPGKLRFEYDPPSPTSLIADGRSVVVRDRKLNTQDIYFLSQTPLRFLLADHIDLAQDANVVGLSTGNGIIAVTMEEKEAIGGSSTIQMRFSADDYTLKEWTVTDSQGYDTTVAISDIDTVDKPPSRYFVINEVPNR